MKLIKLTVLAAALSLVASTGFANTLAAPRSCPGTSQIISAGLMMADVDQEDGVYVAGQLNTYGTVDTWAFVVLLPLHAASSEIDALDKARAALPSLTGRPSPIAFKGKFICLYNNLPNGYKAAAITPVSVAGMTHGSVFKFIQ
jgi:hypothetical protein